MKQTICPSCGGSLCSETIGWRCKKCKGFISLQDGKFYEYVEKPFMPPMTNADRIRAMSDEELADCIYQDVLGIVCKTKQERNESCSEYMCRDCLLEWLKQPAE